LRKIYEDYKIVKKKTILKSIESLEKRKNEHEAKLEKGKIENLEDSIIDYWEKEIKIFEREIQKNRERLEK